MESPHTVYHHYMPKSKANHSIEEGLVGLRSIYNLWLEGETQDPITPIEESKDLELSGFTSDLGSPRKFYIILGYRLPEPVTIQRFFSEMKDLEGYGVSGGYDFSKLKLVSATLADQASGDIYCLFDHKAIEAGDTRTDRGAVRFSLIMALNSSESSDPCFMLHKRDYKAIDEIRELGFVEDSSCSSDLFVKYCLSRRPQSPKTVEA